MIVHVRVCADFALFLRPCTEFEHQENGFHFPSLNFMSSLAVTMEIHYHGVFVPTLDPFWPTQSLLSTSGHVVNLLMLGISFLSNLCKQF